MNTGSAAQRLPSCRAESSDVVPLRSWYLGLCISILQMSQTKLFCSASHVYNQKAELAACTLELCSGCICCFAWLFLWPSAKSLQLRKLQTVLISGSASWSQQHRASVQRHTLRTECLTKPHGEASIKLMTKTEDKRRRSVRTRQLWPRLRVALSTLSAFKCIWFVIVSHWSISSTLSDKHSKACKLLLDVSLLPRDRRHKNMLWSQRTA